MAIFVHCLDASKLLRKVRHAIDEGIVRTWSYDEDGDFTHVGQWKNVAWLRPKAREELLSLTILPPRELPITRAVYGVYHGRFVEMLLSHFDAHFFRAEATALAGSGDRLK